MLEYDETMPWAHPDWQAEAQAWIQSQLKALGRTPTGESETTHVRQWSTIQRVPTDDGLLYFKAVAAGFRNEIALSELLGRLCPECVLPVLASDTERGWMLLPDGGETLRKRVLATKDSRLYETPLRLYADLQKRLADRCNDILATGTPDMRLSVLPRFLAQLLADTDLFQIDQPNGLTRQEYDRLLAIASRLNEVCDRLADYGIPETMQHDDLHCSNILVRGDGRLFLFDWGDGVVSHPFFTLVAFLRNAAARLDLPDDSPEILRLRDLYLTAWTEYGSLEVLQSAWKIADALGMLCRAHSWWRVVQTQASPQGDWLNGMIGWLRKFQNAPAVADFLKEKR